MIYIKKRTLLLLILLLSGVTPSCAGKVTKLYSARIGGRNLRLELAVTPQERRKGLMFRDSLPEGRGMLFAFPSPRILSFWMKNTRIPLSIAFIGEDWRIVAIRRMQPYNRNPVTSRIPARYALEVPQGWFHRHGITTGNRLYPGTLLLQKLNGQ